jgi:hypothetical protein
VLVDNEFRQKYQVPVELYQLHHYPFLFDHIDCQQAVVKLRIYHRKVTPMELMALKVETRQLKMNGDHQVLNCYHPLLRLRLIRYPFNWEWIG